MRLGIGRGTGLIAELQCVFLQSVPLDAENVIKLDLIISSLLVRRIRFQIKMETVRGREHGIMQLKSLSSGDRGMNGMETPDVKDTENK